MQKFVILEKNISQMLLVASMLVKMPVVALSEILCF